MLRAYPQEYAAKASGQLGAEEIRKLWTHVGCLRVKGPNDHNSEDVGHSKDVESVLGGEDKDQRRLIVRDSESCSRSSPP